MRVCQSRRYSSFLILRKYMRINQLLLPLKSSENDRSFDDFRGEGERSINSLNIRSEIWRLLLRRLYFGLLAASICIEAICHIILKHLAFRSKSLVFRSNLPIILMCNSGFHRKTKFFKLKNDIFQSLYQRAKFFRSKSVVIRSDARRSHMIIGNVNLTMDGETTCPVSLSHIFIAVGQSSI